MMQSELPEGWRVERLTQVARVGAPKGWKPTPVEGKIPFVAMADVDELTGLASKHVLREFAEVSKGRVRFGADAILVAKITPCVENNKTALAPEIPADGGFATTEVFAVHPGEVTDRRFLLYFLRSPYARDFLIGSMTGTTGRQRVPKDALERLRVPLPPLEEQRRIVARIEELTRRIEQARQLRRAGVEQAEKIMAAALAEVFERAEEAWQSQCLGEVAETTSGGTPRRSKDEYFGGEIPWVKSGELNDGFIEDTEEKLTEAGVGDSNAKVFPDGTVLVAMYGATVGKTGILKLPAATNQAVCAVFPHEEHLDRMFVYYFFRWKRPALLDSSFGGAQPNISQKFIRALEIPAPPLEEQRRMVLHLDGLQAQVDQLRCVQEDTWHQLDALMPAVLAKAFRGEL